MARKREAVAVVLPLTPEAVGAARARLGLVQREMASVLGVDLSAYQRWEGGQRKVHPSAARLLAALERDAGLLAALRAPAA